MKILADANIASMIVAQLRSLGHDVLYAAELATQDDVMWLQIARDEDRVLLTEDKDFGELVFRRQLVAGTVILFRLHDLTPTERAQWLASRWEVLLQQPSGAFVVVTRDRMRVRRRDGSSRGE